MNAKHLLFPLLFGGLCAVTEHSSAQALQQSKQSLYFLENKGQVTDQYGNPRNDINFRIGGSGLSMFAGSGQLHYQWVASTAAQPDVYNTYRMDVTLLGADPQAKVITEQPLSYYERYYLPQFGEQGATAHVYGKIIYKDVYPNIDWVLYVNNNTVEYDFIVRPGGKVSDIKLQYAGASNLSIDKTGRLTATTPMGSITEAAPVSYQQESNKPVSSFFTLNDNTVSFATGDYSGTLVIDPTLSWSTYYGGSGVETVRSGCITGDNYNNRYFTAHTTSTANIATTGSFQSTIASTTDAFFVKLNSIGVRQWATYYGGTGTESASGITCDTIGNIYLSGTTSSSGLGTTGSHQTTGGGGQDAFLAKFDTAGARIWGTYYGGTSTDQGWGVSCDNNNNVYLFGTTNSSASIASTTGFKTTNSGGTDAFLVKFNSNGVRQWATYYGGTGLEQPQGIASDDSSNVYFTGYTMSSSNISSTGSYQSAIAGSEDGFLVKFDSSGSRLWATYYGGTGDDEPYAVKCDLAGNVYIAGQTTSSTGIGTTGSYQPTIAGGVSDAFLIRFNKNGLRQWGSYYGGTGNDVVGGIASNSLGNLYLIGATTSTAGIATAGTYQDTLGGVQDAFLVKFDTSGNRLWGTYFGGELADYGYGVYCNNFSRVFISGYTKSYTGIASSGAYQTTYGGGTYDGFIADFNDCILSSPTAIMGNDTVCRNVSFTYSVTTIPGATSYTWVLPAGWSGSSTTNNIAVIPASNSDTIKVIANFACGSSTMTIKPVTVNPLPALNPSGTISICNGDSTTLTTATGTSYVWLKNGTVLTGATTQNLVANTNGVYAVVVTNSLGCSDTSVTDTVIVHPIPVPVITASGTMLTTGSFLSFQWNHNGTPITGATSNSYNVTVTSGNYTVTVTDTNGCSGTSGPFDAATLGIYEVNGQKIAVNIYPNPVTDYLYITSEQQLSVTVTSIEGRVLGHYKNATKIDLAGLANGIYLIHLFDKDGIPVGTEKISKQTTW